MSYLVIYLDRRLHKKAIIIILYKFMGELKYVYLGPYISLPIRREFSFGQLAHYLFIHKVDRPTGNVIKLSSKEED